MWTSRRRAAAIMIVQSLHTYDACDRAAEYLTCMDQHKELPASNSPHAVLLSSSASSELWEHRASSVHHISPPRHLKGSALSL